MIEIDATPVTGPALATLLGLSVRRVQQLARDGVLERDAAGKFALGPAIQGYLKVRADPQEAEWRRRHERAMALLAEHKLLKLDGVRADPMQLWPQWLEVWNAHFSRVIAMVLGSLPPRLTAIADPFGAQDVLRDALFAELHRAADELEERTPEPHRTLFRERRAREIARLAAIQAAEDARRAKTAAFNREMDARGKAHGR